MSKLRNFVFTINNPGEEDDKNIKALCEHCVYLTYGREKGKEGTPHYQGYAELARRTSFNKVKRQLPRAHIEGRRGTQAEAIRYCHKEDSSPFVHGAPKEQGLRTDLRAMQRIAAESGMREVSAIAKNAQQITVAKAYLTWNEMERDFKPRVVWYWGKPGIGKSRRCREELAGGDIFTKNTGTKWWDGYDAHEAVILDDFRGSWWPITYMLGLIDRYPFLLEVKGGHRQMLARDIFITSVQHPKEMYNLPDEPIEQLLRRIDKIVHITDFWEPPSKRTRGPEVAEG